MSKEIIRSVIDSVLWTCGATKENRELLAEVIDDALVAAEALTIIELHEAYYAHSGNSKIDYEGREWGDFVGGWDAAIAAKAAS